jgi:tRNA(Ile2) C34 agmatinyltransferase TiaS
MACAKCTGEDVDGTCLHEVMAAVRADREEAVSCPTCDGEAGEMGSLGLRKHYQCRACGMQFSSKGES